MKIENQNGDVFFPLSCEYSLEARKNMPPLLVSLSNHAPKGWKSGQLLCALLALTFFSCAQAKIISGSSSSTIQISGSALLDSVNGADSIDLGGGSLYYGNNIAIASRGVRGTTSKKTPKVKNGKISVPNNLLLEMSVDGLRVPNGGGNFSGVFPNGMASIPTTMPGIADTVQGAPVSGSLNAYVDLNGETTTLSSQLVFTNGVFPYNGTINLNGQQLLISGPVDIVSGGDLVLQDAQDVSFTNNIVLNSTWTFDGDGIIAGNGGVLDLTGGGVLSIHPNTSLAMHNFVLRGVQDGSIVLADDSSEVRFANMVLELSDNYTVTTGGLYIDGQTMIVTADNILTLAQQGSMTVDRSSLQYDTLSFPDQQNITPALGSDPNNKHVISLNNGVIRRLNSPTQGSQHISGNTGLDTLTVVHPNRQLYFDSSATLDGNTFTLLFSKALQPLITVAAGRNAVIENAVLEYFSPSYLDVGTGASLTFGDKTAMTFAFDQDLNTTLTFNGQCSINGNNHTLALGDHGGLMISGSGSALLLENMVITGLSGTKINCTDGTCTVSLNNVRFVLDGSYEFPTERVEILN
ncbi:hypothetical protein FJ365_05905 [Candidatus Dependentiae bacterium]|nr:hypothetical protein [Candidatus Dependentiae bacterium]